MVETKVLRSKTWWETRTRLISLDRKPGPCVAVTTQVIGSFIKLGRYIQSSAMPMPLQYGGNLIGVKGLALSTPTIPPGLNTAYVGSPLLTE